MNTKQKQSDICKYMPLLSQINAVITLWTAYDILPRYLNHVFGGLIQMDPQYPAQAHK